MRSYFMIAVLLWSLQPAVAEDPGDLSAVIVPPDLVLQQRQEIGLSDAQAKLIETAIQQTMAKMPDLQTALQRESAAFTVLMHAHPVDERRALAQLNRVLDCERPIKLLQMSLMITVSNALAPAQRDQIRQLMAASPGGGPQRPGGPLQDKMQRVQECIQAWQKEGRDLSAIGEKMRRFDQLQANGQMPEAMAVLDEVLAYMAGISKGP